MIDNFQKLLSFGSVGTGNEQLNGPSAIAVDPPYIWVADQLNSRILKWRLQGGKYAGVISDLRSYAMEVINDLLVVMDTYNDVIKVYDKHTLSLLRTSAEFTNPSGMARLGDYLYVADDTDNAIYKTDPNTLAIVETLQLSGVAGAYEDIASDGIYLYLLTGARKIYRINGEFQYDGLTADLSASIASSYYVNIHGDYIFISGNEANFLVLDKSFQLIEDVTFDTADWSSLFDAKTIAKNVFIAADYVGDQLIMMYGFDRDAGLSSGDPIVIGGDWDFGDDVIIGGDESNLSTIKFIGGKDSSREHTRYAWKRSA